MSVLPPDNPLSYVGKEPVKRDYLFRRNPTASDFSAYEIGDSWINFDAGSFFVLVSKAGGTATWAVGGGTGAAGVATINTISPDGAGNFMILGGTNVTVTPGVNSITISSLDVGATSFPANAGTANEAAGVLSILGGTNISTVGAGNIITINSTAAGASNFDVDTGANVVPAAGIVQIKGSSATSIVASGLQTHTDAANEIYLENRRFPSAFIVDATSTIGNRGEFTTITAAMAAASAGDTIYVRPGTYGENFSLALNTSLVGLTGPGEGRKVIIAGTLNAPVGAGTTIVQNISGTTGGARGIEMNGGAGSNMLFYDCDFSHTSNVMRWVSGNVEMSRCELNSSGAITISNDTTGGGTGQFNECEIISGGATTVSLAVAVTTTWDNCTITRTAGGGPAISAALGTTNCFHCDISGSMEQSEGACTYEYCNISESFQTDDATCTFLYCNWGSFVNADDAVTFEIHHCNISSVGSSALRIVGGAGGTATVTHTHINTATSPAINVVGGDTLTYSHLSFESNSEISGAGTKLAMTLPCSFHAFLPATVAGATGAGAVFTLGTTTVLTERFDSGSNFVPAGTFTAPVTGTYEFTVRWVFGSLAAPNDDLVCDVVATGVTYEIARLNIDALSNPANEAAVTGTVLVQMSSGDTATFTATESGGGAASVDIVGAAAGDATYVMGRLINS